MSAVALCEPHKKKQSPPKTTPPGPPRSHLELGQGQVHKLLVQHGLGGEVGGGRADKGGLELGGGRAPQREFWSDRACYARSATLRIADHSHPSACNRPNVAEWGAWERRGRGGVEPAPKTKRLTAAAATRRAGAGAARATRARRAGARAGRAAVDRANAIVSCLGGGRAGKKGRIGV